jgi:cytochrome oxidase Cu insertion factor (SCO1/SenC/PrrC family)
MLRILLTLGLVIPITHALAAQEPPGLAKSKLKPREGKLQIGDAVPAFELQDLQGKNPVTLENLKGKPTVLIFGSCT